MPDPVPADFTSSSAGPRLPPVISTRVSAAVRGRRTGTTSYLSWSEP